MRKKPTFGYNVHFNTLSLSVNPFHNLLQKTTRIKKYEQPLGISEKKRMVIRKK